MNPRCLCGWPCSRGELRALLDRMTHEVTEPTLVRAGAFDWLWEAI